MDDEGPLFVCGECSAAGCRSFCRPGCRSNTLFSVTSACCVEADATCGRVLWLLWRIALFGVFLAGLIGSLVRTDARYLVFYTNYTYLIEMGTVSLLLVNTLVSLFWKDGWERAAPVSAIFFEVSCAHSATVLLLYWALLRSSLFWTTFFVHMANFVVLTIDACFNRIRFQPLHVLFVLGVMVIYIIYAMIYQAVSGSVVYDGYSNFDNPGLLVGLIVALLVLNALFFFLFLVLSYYTHDCCGRTNTECEMDIQLLEMR